MAYTCFESQNMLSTHYAKRIFDAVCDAPVENGTFGYLDGVVEEGGVIYKFVPGVKDGCEIVVADQPAWTEDTSRMTNQRKDKFRIEANVPFRCRVVAKNDEMGFSAEGFVGEPVIGKYVTIDANGKLAVANEATDAPRVGKIMRKRQIGSTLVTGIRTYGYARMMYTVKVETLA